MKPENALYTTSTLVKSAYHKVLEEDLSTILPDQIQKQKSLDEYNQHQEQLKTNFDIPTLRLSDGSFLIQDINADNCRHLIYATKQQLLVLSQVEIWYVDTTFQVFNHPYTRLLSIHAFGRSQQRTECMPLAFAIMCPNTIEDYVIVLNAIIKALPTEAPCVKTIVLDYEQAMWRAVQKVLPVVQLRGCSVRWRQTIEQRIKDTTLQADFETAGPVRNILRQVLALLYLPPSDITLSFKKLSKKIDEYEDWRLRDFFEYMNEMWIEHELWQVKTWSVHNCVIRTFFDVDNWHATVLDKLQESQSMTLLTNILLEKSQVLDKLL